MSFVALGRGEHKNVRSQESYPSFHPLWSWHWKGWRDVHEDNEHHLAPMHRNAQLDGDQAWFFGFGSWADNYGNFDLWKPKTFSLACNLFSLLTDGEWFGQIPRLLVILTIENLCFLLHVFFFRFVYSNLKICPGYATSTRLLKEQLLLGVDIPFTVLRVDTALTVISKIKRYLVEDFKVRDK